MTAKEAVTLFKSECFNKREWKRFSKRYYTRNCSTIVKTISKRYNISEKKIKEELMLQMKAALAE